MSCLLVMWSVLSIFTAVRASQNLANGKPSSQSSTYRTYDSSKAIDGCTTQTLTSNCCTHTDFYNTEAWWQVDLQQQSVIETVHIIYRTDGYLKRLAGFEIFLSNTANWRSGERCYQDNTQTLQSLSAEQYVPCPGVARYLTIYSDRRAYTYTWYSTYAFLELCEVSVNGCILRKFGNGHCNGDCLNCLDSLCHTTSGVCDNCGSGYYKISNSCFPCPTNCAGNTCDGTTGACSDGCFHGYSGTYCKCPANCGDQKCSTGSCSNCNNGYYGPTCTPCPPGCNGNTCNKTSGICLNGCLFGFSGPYCNCPVNCDDDYTCPSGNCTRQSTEKQNEADMENVTINAVLGTFLGISICCNIGFVVFYLRHFFRKKSKTPTKTPETYEIPSARCNDDGRNYQELGETKVDSAKNIYDTIQG